MRETIIAAAILSALLMTAPAAAESITTCPAPQMPLEEPWTSWTQNTNIVAGHMPSDAASLVLGKPVTATLAPVSQLQFPTGSANVPRSHSRGGVFTLSLIRPARVGIGLSSSAASVDIVSDMRALEPLGVDNGADCAGLARIIWFDLAEGRHLVQVSGVVGETVRIMAADEHANQPMRR